MRALRRLRATLVLVLPLVVPAASACSTTPSEGSGRGGTSSTGGSSLGASTGLGGGTGGALSPSGGATPGSGGATPGSGGATPGSGGAPSGLGGASMGGSSGMQATGGATTGGAGGATTGGSPSAGAAGMPGTMLKGPILRDGKCIFEFGDIYFEVTPSVAGRITSARLLGSEILTGPSVHATNYGSTFWTSPQADWNWPPVPEIDNLAFTHTADAISCTVVGPKAVSAAHPAVDGVSVTKKFTVDLAKQSMVVDYIIKNESTTVKRLAPWEITRVAAGGLTFYASDTAPTGTKMPPTNSANGHTFFQHSASVPVDSKLFADGKGWIAHATIDKRLLVKSFADVPPGLAATAEAEIEIYSNATYVEVENQGVPVDIAAGSSSTWTVRWYLKQLPASVTLSPNNPELIQFVQQTLQ